MYHKLGLFSVRDEYTARVTDALFRYIWRHHEADCFVAHLASRLPVADSLVAAANDVTKDATKTRPRLGLPAPSQTLWTFETTQRAVVKPSDAAHTAVCALITAIDKATNPATAARKSAAFALSALHAHLFYTVYTNDVVEELSQTSPCGDGANQAVGEVVRDEAGEVGMEVDEVIWAGGATRTLPMVGQVSLSSGGERGAATDGVSAPVPLEGNLRTVALDAAELFR